MGVLSLTSTGIKLGQPRGHLEALLVYCACFHCQCFRAVQRLPLHLLLSTIPTQIYTEKMCTYHGARSYGSGRVAGALRLQVISAGDLGHTWTAQEPWDAGPVAYCFGESNDPMAALRVGILLSDFCIEIWAATFNYSRLRSARFPSGRLGEPASCKTRAWQFTVVTHIWSLLHSAITYIFPGWQLEKRRSPFCLYLSYTNISLQKRGWS